MRGVERNRRLGRHGGFAEEKEAWFRNFLDFIIASLIGRGGRFFLVALLLAASDERLETKLREYMDRLGWGLVTVVAVGGLIYHFTY